MTTKKEVGRSIGFEVPEKQGRNVTVNENFYKSGYCTVLVVVQSKNLLKLCTYICMNVNLLKQNKTHENVDNLHKNLRWKTNSEYANKCIHTYIQLHTKWCIHMKVYEHVNILVADTYVKRYAVIESTYKLTEIFQLYVCVCAYITVEGKRNTN